MSAIGSARARGPEMWSDISSSSRARPDVPAWSVRSLVEQRLEHRVLQRLGGLGVVQHLLEGRVDSLGLPNLLHGAAVVPRVGGSRLLRVLDERLHRRQVGETLVALDLSEDRVE